MLAASSFARCGLKQPVHRLVHILKPTGGREGDAGGAMDLNGLNSCAQLSRSSTD